MIVSMDSHMATTDEFVDLLRRHGRKVTAQRLRLFQAVAAHGRHATAEEIYERALPSLPTISLTTVYNTLHELVALGLLRRVELGDGTARFDPNCAPHAHIVCRLCRRTEDLPATDFVVALPPATARGYSNIDHEVVFYGLCPICQAAGAPTHVG